MTDAPRTLTELHALPDGLLDCASAELAARLGGPTLIHLPGAREPALFVAVLTHGNEPVGWDAVRLLLTRNIERHGRLRLPRALSLFIGNVNAAAVHARHLPDQPDFNRIWPGTELPPTALPVSGLGPSSRTWSVNSLMTSAKRTPSAAEIHSSLRRPSSMPSSLTMFIVFSNCSTARSLPKM